MVHLGDVPPKFLALLSKAVGLFLLIVCFFVLQRIFDLDFLCICRPGLHRNYFLFILLPPLILTWLVILTEPFYQKSFCSCSNRCRSNFCSWFCNVLIKYVCMVVVWASTVLLDGDWYFCLMTNLDSSQTGLPCRENLTYEEKLIKAEYKNTSLDIGFGVIGGMFLAWNLFECLKFCVRRTTCRECCSKSSYKLLCPPYYRAVYEDLLSEAVNSRLEEELKKLAEERAKQICKKHLEIIRNHEMPGQNQDGDNVTNNSGNPPAGDVNNSPNGNANGNPDGHPNENPDGNLDDNPNENPDGDSDVNHNGNVTENPDGNPDSNPSGHPGENPNNNPNGNNEGDIFDTWQKISLSSFYLMNENE